MKTGPSLLAIGSVLLLCGAACFWVITSGASTHQAYKTTGSIRFGGPPVLTDQDPVMLKSRHMARKMFPSQAVAVKGRPSSGRKNVRITGTNVNVRLFFDSDGGLENLVPMYSMLPQVGKTQAEVQRWLEEFFESDIQNLRMVSRWDADMQIAWANEREGNKVYFEVNQETYSMSYKDGKASYIRRDPEFRPVD